MEVGSGAIMAAVEDGSGAVWCPGSSVHQAHAAGARAIAAHSPRDSGPRGRPDWGVAILPPQLRQERRVALWWHRCLAQLGRDRGC